MAKPNRVTLRSFLGRDLLSGNVRVVCRLPQREGARPPRGKAIEESQIERAATDGGSGETGGGVAPSANATAPDRETLAGAAQSEAEKAGRVPKKKRETKEGGVNPPLQKRRGKKKSRRARGLAVRYKRKAQDPGKTRYALSPTGSGEPPNECGRPLKPKDKDIEDSEGLWDRRLKLGKGPELPEGGRGFLRAVNEQIDVVSMYVLLLRSPDDKLAGRLAEQLLKLGYGEDALAEMKYDTGISAHLPWAKRD